MTSEVAPAPSLQLHLQSPITAKLTQSDASISPGIFTSISLPFKKRRSRSDVSESSSNTSLPFKKRRFLIIPIATSSDDEATDRTSSSLGPRSPIAVPSLNVDREQGKVVNEDASSSIACVTPVPKATPKQVQLTTKSKPDCKSNTSLPSLEGLDPVGTFSRLMQTQVRKTRSSATKSSENSDSIANIPETKQTLETPKKQDKTKSNGKRPRDTLYRGESADEIRCLAISTRGKRCCYAAVACNGNEYCHRHTSSFANKNLEANDNTKTETTTSSVTTTKISKQEPPKPIPLRSSPRSRSVVVPAQEAKATPAVIASKAPAKEQTTLPRPPRALSDISSDLWENQTVRISNGPHKSKIATVIRWGNGWVTVALSGKKHAKNPSKLFHNRRSHDLLLV